MKALSIRNLPDDIYDALKAMAVANHRSLQEQVRCMIEREARLANPSCISVARQWRAKLAGRELGDTIAEIREDRAR